MTTRLSMNREAAQPLLKASDARDRLIIGNQRAGTHFRTEVVRTCIRDYLACVSRHPKELSDDFVET